VKAQMRIRTGNHPSSWNARKSAINSTARNFLLHQQHSADEMWQ